MSSTSQVPYAIYVSVVPEAILRTRAASEGPVEIKADKSCSGGAVCDEDFDFGRGDGEGVVFVVAAPVDRRGRKDEKCRGGEERKIEVGGCN